MRHLVKQWRNGSGVKWTARVRWYGGVGSDVRLRFVLVEWGEWNEYFGTAALAQARWDEFMGNPIWRGGSHATV